MSFTKIAVRRPVTTAMVVLVVIVFGVLSITNLKLDLLPNMNIPIAIVSTTYSGTAPTEMETLVTKPIEGALGTVAGVKEITSSSSYGSSIVVIQFENDVDIDNAALDMREKVDMIKSTLPDDATDPMVIKLDINSLSSLQLGVTSKDASLVDLKRIVDDKIVNRFERQDGVASVSVSGGREKEIKVTLKTDQLRGYGVSESTVQQLLAAENRTTPTGSVKQGDKNLSLRVTGEFNSLEDIRNLPITTPAGTVIYLRDVADVTEEFIEESSYVYMNGEPCVMVSVQKQSTANTVEVSDRILKEMDLIRAEMPDVTFTVLMDPADYINDSINTVVDSAVMGGILALVILYIFLRNVRSTLVVGISIPVSIIATFVLMYYTDITINIMSLGGLTLGVGMLVDNSIVVLESIYRKMEEGVDRITAAIEGSREVGMSVTASTLTTVAVFLPISFAGGLTAQIFNEMSMTIAFSLVSSLIVSLTVVPMACSLILKPNIVKSEFIRKNIFTRFMDLFGVAISALEKGYGIALEKALSHRRVTFLIVVAFVVATLATLPLIGMEFMPSTDQGLVTASITMPNGTRLEETMAATEAAVAAVENEPEIDFIGMLVGGGMGFGSSTSDSATLYIGLVPLAERSRSSDEITQYMNDLVKNIPGAEIKFSASQMSMGSYGSGSSVQFDIKGEELDALIDIADDFVAIMETVDGTRDVESSVEDASPQATITIDRNKASSYGISSASVASVINTAIAGSKATTFKVDGDELDIRVLQDKQTFDYITDVQNLLVPSATGVNVPLYEIADIKVVDMPVSISRSNHEKYVSVTADIELGRDLNGMTNSIKAALASYPMPANYSWEVAGTSQQMDETFSSLGLALLMAVLLVFMIMAAEFESFIDPLIVMFSLPIALTGGIFGLFVMGESLSITGFLGLIMLAGIVVNNAIVLVDYTNLLMRERGYGVEEALKIAGPVRLRPILMTTLTTVLALVPMMLAGSEGGEMMRGLAIVVVFGLSLSTLVTLLFIPTLFLAYHKRRDRFAEKRNILNHRKDRKSSAMLSKEETTTDAGAENKAAADTDETPADEMPKDETRDE